MHSNCYANGGKTLFTAQRKALLYYTCVCCTDRWCLPSFRFRGVEYGLASRLVLTFFFFSTGVFSGFSTLVSSPTGSGSVFLSSLVSYLANHFRACLARDKNIKLVWKTWPGSLQGRSQNMNVNKLQLRGHIGTVPPHCETKLFFFGNSLNYTL